MLYVNSVKMCIDTYIFIMKFNDYIKNRETVNEMISIKSIKDFMKRWPATIGASVLGAATVGLGSYLKDKTEKDYHLSDVEKLKPGLPPLPKNPKPPKIIKKIDDTGRA